MPLPMRKVEPVFVGRGNLPDKYKIANDLEAHANGTLSNVILQLSSLSHHAEEIFNELFQAATDITTRSAKVQSRLDRLAEKLDKVDTDQNDHSLYDCVQSKPFQSAAAYDQQIVGRNTMSIGMLKTLASCDRPPPLENLNVYRDDGRDGLKFYTDPNYFFELWRQEVLEATDKNLRKPHKAKKDGAQRNRKSVRQLIPTREKQKDKALQQGEIIMSPTSLPATTSQTDSQRIECDDGVLHLPQQVIKRSTRPTSAEIRKHVSFEDRIDEDEEQSEPISNGDQRYDLSNGYLIHAYNNSSAVELDGFLLAQSLERKCNVTNDTPPDSSLPSPSTTSDSGLGSSLSNGKDMILEDFKCPPNSFGELIHRNSTTSSQLSINAKKRRSSNGSQSSLPTSSSRSSLSGSVTRPSQPPPAPPVPTITMQANGPVVSISAGTPNGTVLQGILRNSLPPPPPPPAEDGSESNVNYPPPPHDIGVPVKNPDDTDDELPPPPPDVMDLPHPPRPEDEVAPPTPPPPPMGPPPPPLPPLEPVAPGVSTNGTAASKPQKAYIPPTVDPRNQLMESIRIGVPNLKKVEVKEKAPASYGDVASILAVLARRQAVAPSDSESSASDEDSEGWDDEDNA